jgi:hypothetical protein
LLIETVKKSNSIKKSHRLDMILAEVAQIPFIERLQMLPSVILKAFLEEGGKFIVAGFIEFLEQLFKL